MIFGDTISILRPATTGRDRYNNEVLDWDGATPIPVERLVSVQPASMTEGAGGRAVALVSTWRLITPAGMDLDLLPIDRVFHNGRYLEVVGEIERWPHPIVPGAVHHVEAGLQKASD